ncbi:MAG: CoA-binding protein [Candidatus Bathyarchaeia archaeon]|nr:CoA-binding protein [Candidatus Bathyarchaeota archaeon]
MAQSIRGDIKNILSRYRTVAVVGVSRDPLKDSRIVAEYLMSRGYEVIPINPFIDELLGKRCYKTLLDMPEEVAGRIDIVDIFRPAEETTQIVEQAIRLRKMFGRPDVIWMQLGIVNEEAARMAEEAGMVVIMDRCIKIEHSRMKDTTKTWSACRDGVNSIS